MATRFNARLSEEQKSLLQRAADLKGMSLSDFILGTAHDEAMRVIEAHEVIRLSRRDSAAFLESVQQAPPPSPDAVQKFRRAIKRRAE